IRPPGVGVPVPAGLRQRRGERRHDDQRGARRRSTGRGSRMKRKHACLGGRDLSITSPRSSSPPSPSPPSPSLPSPSPPSSLPALIGGVALACATAVVEAQTAKPVSGWSGVYTAAQNKRGEELHAAVCIMCHGRQLNGAAQPEMPPSPAIARAAFLRKWG